MWTRKQYLDGDCTHEQYYGSIAEDIGFSYTHAPEAFLRRVQRALEANDPHLNTVPLVDWDTRGRAMIAYHGDKVERAFKARGDTVSLCGLVCLCKYAARKAAMGMPRERERRDRRTVGRIDNRNA